MFFGSIRIARLLGIPILVDYTWIVLFLLVTYSLIDGQFRFLFPRLSLVQAVGFGLLTSLLFFASVVLHELAHSALALRFGIPVKNITLFMLGGVSQIAHDANRPLSELVIAVAGPLSSLMLAAVFTVIWMVAGPLHHAIAAAASTLIFTNMLLAVFNLIPGFPLDGGRVFRALLWWQMGDHRRATRVATRVGQAVAYAFIAGGLAIVFFSGGRFLTNGIWLVVIGWFLLRAAAGSYRQELVHEALQGYSVRNLMAMDLPAVPQDLSLRRLADQYFAPGHPEAYLVVEGNELRGTIARRDLRKVKNHQLDHATVRDAMTPLTLVLQLHPDADALQSLERMDEAGTEAAPVVEHGRVVGFLGRDALLAMVRQLNRRAA